jgi:hypothetical protein
MVEVFKTNINDPEQARALVELIQQVFEGYRVNFDLDDCDRILRIACTDAVDSGLIINLLHDYGCYAEVLEDVVLIPGV